MKNETTTTLHNVVDFKDTVLHKRSHAQNCSVCYYLYKVQRQALVIYVGGSQDDTYPSELGIDGEGAVGRLLGCWVTVLCVHIFVKIY